MFLSAVPAVPGVVEDSLGARALHEGCLRVPVGGSLVVHALAGVVLETLREEAEEVVPLVGDEGRGRDVVVHVSVVPQVGVGCTGLETFFSAPGSELTGLHPESVCARDGQVNAHSHGIASPQAAGIDLHHLT